MSETAEKYGPEWAAKIAKTLRKADIVAAAAKIGQENARLEAEVARLATLVKTAQACVTANADGVIRERAEVARLRAALEIYANPRNWDWEKNVENINWFIAYSDKGFGWTIADEALRSQQPGAPESE